VDTRHTEKKRIWLCGAAIVLTQLTACVSRTVPLPPPEVGSISAPDGDGFVTVSGYALEGASVGVINELTQEGVVVATQGAGCDSACPFEAHVKAAAGDPLRLWQFFETENSKETAVPSTPK
jgi:hypothetical protein